MVTAKCHGGSRSCLEVSSKGYEVSNWSLEASMRKFEAVSNRWEDSGALVNNRWAEFHETSGGGRGRLEVLGDQGNKRFCTPNPDAFLHKKGDSSGTTEAIASKMASIEGSRRVE
ncbi:hypothetical protein PISMIDRAFT_686384 [Pisolithus microcarpus 441]|uniref:Uncharacterized protein n=1 Tax=Pisolithus microcarpus 441 TaxID=765257 RepID=A0A0C9YR78_9AGAM|nr:hypothetical protein BKA83DRAFT_686384 [Pisolithus microcarpus]KIK16349.1 hypothetical protein PISMIDRAFT_686384 [Pisolithus microcarpus 441]